MTPDELNGECISRLRSANLSGRVVIVGSGPSSEYIAPIARLQELLCTRCGILTVPSERFWAFSERAYLGNPDEYYRVIRETYGDPPHWSADIYQHLAAISFQGFATINYDPQLPKAFRNRYPEQFEACFSVYPPPNGQTYFNALELRGLPRKLIALHGYGDPENAQWERQIILRKQDYEEHYNPQGAALFDWWRTLLLSGPCIFVGTSLEEPGLFKVMQYLLRDSKDRLVELNHLHLINVEPHPDTHEYPPPKNSLSVIERVCYDPLDRRFTGLLQVLSHFSRLPIGHPSPRTPAPKPFALTDTIDFNSL